MGPWVVVGVGVGWGHRGVRGCGALCCGFGGARVVWVWDPHSCGVLCGFGVLLDVVCHGFGVPVDVVCCAMGLGSPWIWCIVWVWGPHGYSALCHGFVGSPWMWCIVPQVCGVPMGVVHCAMSLWGPHGCYVLCGFGVPMDVVWYRGGAGFFVCAMGWGAPC